MKIYIPNSPGCRGTRINGYRLPDKVNSSSFDFWNPIVAGEYDLPFIPFTITCAADHLATGKIYVARDGIFAQDNYATITQMDYHTFAKIKEYKFGLNPPENWPIGTTWWMKTEHIFPNPSGNQLWLVNRYPALNHNNPDRWAIEKVSFD